MTLFAFVLVFVRHHIYRAYAYFFPSFASSFSFLFLRSPSGLILNSKYSSSSSFNATGLDSFKDEKKERKSCCCSADWGG